MKKFKIGDIVEWYKEDEVLGFGEITGVKYVSSLGTIYKVLIKIREKHKSPNNSFNEFSIVGQTTKNIHQNNLRLKK